MEDVVLVTGFGPFRDHKTNASWESVKLLPEVIEGHQVLKNEIPVCYTDIENKIPKLWLSNKPKLVIHVGVSSKAKKITIEKIANRVGYEKEDCYQKKHPTGDACTPEQGDDCIPTSINVQEICDVLNKKNEHLEFEISEDAGRYLCEFIYYTSLRRDRNRCIFIHVPPIDTPYSAQQTSNAILQIIECALKEKCVCGNNEVL